MSIRKPDANLATPFLQPLPAGARLHRIHLSAYAGDSFNPGLGGQTRFAPIEDIGGNPVPSLYAASSFNAAAYETIFHDVPATAALKTVPKQLVTDRSHTVLEVTRALSLVSLNDPHVRKWRLRHRDLIATSAKLYGETARWAAAIHDQFPQAEGLLWASNQYTSETAYLFFGDRVAPSDFRIVLQRDGASDKSVLADARRAGNSAGIVITV